MNSLKKNKNVLSAGKFKTVDFGVSVKPGKKPSVAGFKKQPSSIKSQLNSILEEFAALMLLLSPQKHFFFKSQSKGRVEAQHTSSKTDHGDNNKFNKIPFFPPLLNTLTVRQATKYDQENTQMLN